MMTDLREVIARAAARIPVVEDMPLGPVACNEIADAALAAIKAAGYVVLPAEPTEVMEEAGVEARHGNPVRQGLHGAAVAEIYRAMIEAAK